MFNDKKLLLLSIPAVLYSIIYFIYPTITLVISSFNSSDGLFGNYSLVLADKYYIQSLINAFFYAITISLIGITLSVLLAVLMYSLTSKHLQKYLQLSSYTPYILSWVVIFGAWNAIFQPTGLINTILINAGVIDQGIQFWASGEFSRWAVVVMTVWKDIGYNALIFYIALLTIPSTLIEAVQLEKDSIFNKMKTVYIPQIKGTIFVMFMLIFVGALKTFDSAYLTTNSINKELVQTPVVYAYELGLENQVDIANAASMIFLVICLIAVAIVRGVQSKYEK